MQIAVIANPLAGRGRAAAALTSLRKALGNHLVQLVTTSSSEQSTILARAAARAGADTVVAVGGDGTVNAVSNGLAGTGCRLGVVPLGTANDLASCFSIPLKIEAAAAVILAAVVRPIDMIRVNGWHFLTCGGIGFPCEVIRLVERLRRGNPLLRTLCRRSGAAIYATAAAYRLLNGVVSSMQVCIETEKINRNVAAHTVIIANQPRFGRRFCVAPGADNCDGQLDVCLFGDTKSKTNILQNILGTIRGTHAKNPGVELFRASRIAVHTEEETTFFGDGEMQLRACSYYIEVVPRAINVICP